MKNVKWMLVLLLAVPMSAWAQAGTVDAAVTTPPGATTPSLSNIRQNGQPAAAGALNAMDGSSVLLRLTCADGIDCSRLAANAGGTALTASPGATVAGVTFPVRLTQLANSVQVLQGANAVGTLTFTLTPAVASAAAAPPAAAAPGGPRLGQLVEASQSCPAPAGTVGAYDLKDGRASVMVRPNGNLLKSVPRLFDEDDTLEVTVLLREALIPYILVRRKSEFGTAGGIRILGQGVKIPSGLILQSTEADALLAGDCKEYVVPLRDFAPGRGEVEIVAVREGETATLGTFEFNVNPLYTGMFSLGAVWSWNENPKPGLAFNGIENIIVNTERDKQRMLFALLYTPFVWGKRDLEKSEPDFLRRINPTIGLTLSDISHNALLGLSVDGFNGVVLTAGVHISRVEVLSPESGLQPGMPFAEPEERLPTVNEWRAKGFVGLSVDLRAAVELLRTAFTATGG